MRAALGGAALALAAAGAGGAAGAQVTPAGAAPPAASVPGCTYDTCALRRERVFLSERVLAGVNGRVVGRPAFFGVLPAESLVRAVPEAVPYARTYRREALLGQTLVTASSVLGIVAFVDALNTRGSCTIGPTERTCRVGNFDRQLALGAGALVLGGVGGWRLQVSDRALNRAVWYYNRALAR
jgi:hypothetical protein